MKGANADPCVTTISKLKSRSTNATGNSQNFFRTRRKRQNSATMVNLLTVRTFSLYRFTSAWPVVSRPGAFLAGTVTRCTTIRSTSQECRQPRQRQNHVARIFIELWEGLRIAARSISGQKLRSFLTMLGIVIGIVTVTGMFTIINGLERAFENSLSMLGTNVLYVEKYGWFMSPSEWIAQRNRPNITADLVNDIRSQARYVNAVAPSVGSSRPVRYRDRALYGIYIEGSTPEAARISDIDLDAGRWYSQVDLQTTRPVAVIGSEVAEELFPNEQALGKRIRIGGTRFEVIGVLKRQGKFMGVFSFDEQVQVPISTFERLFGRYRSVTIEAKVASGDVMHLAEDELTGIVRTARGVDAAEENNFEINKAQAFRDQIGQVKATIYAIGVFLTGLALVVGGIGVMNIMFVSVKERTREIGVRKAVGAPRRAILIQFLIEAVGVCVGAGIIGVAFSGGLVLIISQFIPAYLAPGTVLLAFSICVGVGIVFGIVPAWNAARQNPIDALRYS